MATKAKFAEAGKDAILPVAQQTIEDGIDSVAQSARALEAKLGPSSDGPQNIQQNTQMELKNRMEKSFKVAEDMMAFSQGNIEACMKASQIWFAGVQDISKQVAAHAQAQMQETMSALKAFGGVKSVREVVDLQASLSRSTIEKTMAETSRLADASIKLTEQSVAPLTARMTLAMDKISRAA